MNGVRRWIVGLAALLGGAACLGALEIREGRVRLILHEDLGRFSLYYLTDLQASTYVPLFVDADPRTSATALLVDNRVTRLGEGSEFQQVARRTAGGAEFLWSSRILQVQQTFELVTSSASQLADGVRMTLTIRNQGEQTAQVGARILLDTYLGETSANHFVADGSRPIARESDLTGSARPRFWSSTRSSDSLGLYYLMSGDGIDAPDRIVFANWQRLNDSTWSFLSSQTRTFSNLPYSINDSAVVSYYGPRSVPAGGSFVVTALLGGSTAGGFTPAPAGTASPEPQTATELLTAIASTEGISDPLLAATTDLGVVNQLLRSIDIRLSTAGTTTDEDLRALERALDDLSARVRDHTAGTTTTPR
jgi:hypothetical protein